MNQKLLLRVAAIAALVAVVTFVAGAAVGYWKASQPSVASVTIVNAAGQRIERLTLAHQSARSSGTIELGPLVMGGSSVARFQLAGEGSYRIAAVLADGTVRQEHGGYVEAGYAVTETLGPTGSVPSLGYGAASRSAPRP